MSHIHEPGNTTTVVEDSSSSALLIVVAVVVGIVLIWAIFFSGWVIDRSPEGGVTNIDNTTEGDTNVNNPPQPTQPTQTEPAPTEPAPTTAP